MAKHGAETHHTLHLPGETWNGLLYSKGLEKSCREEHVPFSRTHLNAEAFIAICHLPSNLLWDPLWEMLHLKSGKVFSSLKILLLLELEARP